MWLFYLREAPLPPSDKPHVLQVHNFYQQAGGEDSVVANEERLLLRRGHQVFQHTLHNQLIPDMAPWQLAVATVWNGEAYKAVRQKIEKHGIGIVHVHNSFPLISPAVYYAARAEKVPVVQTLHNYRLLCPAATLFRSGRTCEDCLGKTLAWPAVWHKCYRKSRTASSAATLGLFLHKSLNTYSQKVDCYIALSEFARKKFVAGGLPANRILVKPNFLLDDNGIGSGAGGYALFAGRLTREKGILTLLEAWSAANPMLRIKVAGDGPLREEVSGWAQTSRRIEYLGQVSKSHLSELMRNASLFVLPSEWYEGIPMSMIEALACGTPVLASSMGALPDFIVPGKSGFLFPAGNIGELTKAIDGIFEQAQNLAELRFETRKCFEANFASAANYDALMGIYRYAMRLN